MTASGTEETPNERRQGVRLGRLVTEDEMIAEFLRAEVDSPRQGARVRRVAAEAGVDVGIIRQPLLTSSGQNAARRRILEDHAGWPAHAVFGGLPTDNVVWQQGSLDRSVLDDVEVIRWLVTEYPEAFPARPLGAVCRARLQGTPGSRVLEADKLARAIVEGRAPPPPILISTPELERLVILEGHNRMVAYALLGAACPDRIDVILGLTPDAAEWSEW